MNILISYNLFQKYKIGLKDNFDKLKECGNLVLVKIDSVYNKNSILELRKEQIKNKMMFNIEIICNEIPTELIKDKFIMLGYDDNDVFRFSPLHLNFKKILIMNLSGKTDKKFKKIIKLIKDFSENNL